MKQANKPPQSRSGYQQPCSTLQQAKSLTTNPETTQHKQAANVHIYCKGATTQTTMRCTRVNSHGLRLSKWEKLSFNCLGHHHVSCCISKYQYHKCTDKHHTSICNSSTSGRMITLHFQTTALHAREEPIHWPTDLLNHQGCYRPTKI